MADLLPINIVIADRTYRIRINPSDEGVIRSALKIINDKIIEYKTHLAGKDMQDYVAMCLIWYATQTDSKDNPLLEKNVGEALLKMELLLDKAL